MKPKYRPTLKLPLDPWSFWGTLTENYHLPRLKTRTLREKLSCDIVNSYLALPKGLVSTLKTALRTRSDATSRPGFHLPQWHTFGSHTAYWGHYNEPPFLIRFAFSKGILEKPNSRRTGDTKRKKEESGLVFSTWEMRGSHQAGSFEWYSFVFVSCSLFFQENADSTY